MIKSTYNFEEGELLLFDKPLGWTSFDLVNKVRYLIKQHLGIKKIKVGHAGTLDPLATGLMVICVGRMTKKINELTQDSKEYEGQIELGAWTPSYDGETAVEKTCSFENITKEHVVEAAASFIGKQEQIPPIFSAKKVNGVRAYKLAREGKDIAMRKNAIEIFEFEILSYEAPIISCSIHCSKGTYIRSIANDFGERLNNLGTLIGLNRTKSGAFELEQALSIDQFETVLADLKK
ncbi:MAG: tRNA pseudouridine(55) synthase TruB [Bacteroidota bacterium]